MPAVLAALSYLRVMVVNEIIVMIRQISSATLPAIYAMSHSVLEWLCLLAAAI